MTYVTWQANTNGTFDSDVEYVQQAVRTTEILNMTRVGGGEGERVVILTPHLLADEKPPKPFIGGSEVVETYKYKTKRPDGTNNGRQVTPGISIDSLSSDQGRLNLSK